jgi:glucokinase
MSVLAADMGATRIKLALVDSGRVLARDVIPAHSDKGLRPRLSAIEEALHRLCESAGVRLPSCDGFGVSFPSLVDVRSGRVLAEYGRYSDVVQLDLREWARDRLGLFAAIENDARMACIGEWRYGAGRGCPNLVMITLGTGLGTGAIIEGRVLRGKHGQAGCFGGHLTVRHGGRLCACGNTGCAEAEASTAFLTQLAAETPGWDESALKNEPMLDYAAVLRLAAQGDPCARKILDHSLSVWGSLAVNLIHAYDPELVILGGGIMAGADLLLPAIRNYVETHAHTPWGKVRVEASQLADDAGIVAAEWLVTEQKKLVLGNP